jgi:uncharacterized RDD family membrane protein YckC
VKCPNCGYISFNNLTKCKKCGTRFTLFSDTNPKIPSPKKASSNAITDDRKRFLRPPDMDKTIASIKHDFEELDKMPGNKPSGITPDTDDIATKTIVPIANINSYSNNHKKIKNAGFFLRLFAYTIDNIILWFFYIILLIVVFLLIKSLSIEIDNPTTILNSILVPYLVTSMIIEIFYFTYFHGVTGQTVGKWICSIKVIDENGNLLGFKRAFIRYVGYLIVRLSLYIGFMWIIFDKKKQGWHDKIARSYVINT